MWTPTPALWISLVAASLAAAAPAPGAAEQLPSSVVAYTGQTAPGTGGATYFLLYQPTITAAGDVSFSSELTGAGVTATNNKGHWRQSVGGPTQLVLRAGDPAPLPGTTWSTEVGVPTAQTVAGAPRSGFFWGLIDGGVPKGALWSEQPGGMHAVAVQGAPAPGLPGATFQPGLPLFDMNFDEAGELLFTAAVTGGGTTTANDQGLWLDNGTTTTLVAREGDPAIGFPAGTVFPGIQSSYSRLAPNSGVTFYAYPFVPSLGMNQTGIWSNRSGSLAPVALQGSSAPGLGPGETIGPGAPYANRTGQIAFLGTIYGGAGGYGLWISDAGGSPALAYRIPNSDPPFQLLGSQFFLADDGIFYEITNTYASGVVHQAIVAIGPSGWREVVHAGERVADLGAGIVYNLFDEYYVNGNGQVAFRATISGPGVSGANNRVLVAQGEDRAFHLVARTGESLEVSPGVFRTVVGMLIPQIIGDGPGVLRAFSDTGGLAWIAQTGGISSAILVTNLGVPPAIQLVGLEAVQVVQDWNASVPLVKGKRTWVRAHFQSSALVRIQPVLRARPVGGGPDLPLSPLRARDLDDSYAVTNPLARRETLLDSTEWVLPPEWTLGDVELEVTLLDQPLDCLESAGPTANDCKVEANFTVVPRPEVTIVSVDFNDGSGVRSVTAKQRLELAERLISAFPVDDLVWNGSVAKWPLQEATPDSCAVRSWIYLRKILDGCREWEGCRRLYYGSLLGAREDGCAQIGGYAAAGFLPPDPYAAGRHNHTHEFGHLLSRQHTVDPTQNPEPDGSLPGFCGEVANPGPPPPPAFPYIHVIDGHRRPTLGPLASGENAKIFGIDTIQKRVAAPEAVFDLMSYCSTAGLDLWPAKVTYEFLKTQIEGRFDAPSLTISPVDGGAQVLLVPGSIDSETGDVVLDPFFTVAGGAPAPTPDPGPYTLRVHRVGGATEDLSFAPALIAGHGGRPVRRPFLFEVIAPETVSEIEIRSGATPLATRSASPNAPTVQLLAPNGGEVLDQATVEVSWSASDGDADPLLFVVQFSADGGGTWTTLESGWPSTSVEIDRGALAGTTDGRFRVQASDGLLTATDDSDGAFSVADNMPEIAILQPDNGELFFDGQALVLEAMTLDPEDGALAGAALTWSSSLDGVLGTGTPVTLAVDSLTEGLHVLTLTAQDSAANVVQTSVQFRIDQPALLFEDDFESGGTTLWH